MAREKIVPVFVPHLGCPNDCVFCNQKRITGTIKSACASDVPQDTDGQIAFYGGSFTAIDVKTQIELLEAAKGHSIRLSTRPDAIDDVVLERLKRYGVETIEIGAQSLDNEVLRMSGRGHSAEDVVRASQMIKQYGFKLVLQMMTGLPGSSDEKDIATAEKIIQLRPDGVRIYPTVIVRDTALFDMWKAGTYKEHTVEDAVCVCSKILPLFEKAGISVIRLGLNPTDDLSNGDAVAGAYHPALGELVRSRILRDEIEQKVINGESCFTVPDKLLSQYLGQHRGNVMYLEEKYHKPITIKSDRLQQK